MRRALLITPHFPPDSSAGAHRVRLLAPYLPDYGWEPTVLTCHPAAYEGHLDWPFAGFVSPTLRVIRVQTLPAGFTRVVGVGDLGLRSFVALLRAASRLLRTERFDALFITIFPAYTALIGPILVRRFGVPFVLDYQDPWVGAWGKAVGGGAGGRPDLKSRLSRRLAEWLEPRAVSAAAAITAVSAGTYEPILRRNPAIRPLTAAIPLGAEPADFHHADVPAHALPFDPTDGCVHMCYTGTILPLGLETLEAVLRAVARLRSERPLLYARLRLHFIGTSNQTTTTDQMRVMPLAHQLGVADVVHEIPTRLPYSDIVEIQRKATVLLAMGSSEAHYTASKIFPILLARRPILAAYHERSSAVDILSRAARAPSLRLVQYSDSERAASCESRLFEHLVSLIEAPTWSEADLDLTVMDEFLAERLAGRLADVFDRVVGASAK